MANDIEIYQGNDRTLKVTVVDSDGAAYDLSTADLYFDVKKFESDTPSIISKSSAVVTEIKILSPATDGIFEVYLLPADTENIVGKKVYDLTMDEGGKIYTLIKADFTVTLPVK